MIDQSRRYFYTDPLAAAWMAKRFEMRFLNLKEIIQDVDGDIVLLCLPKFVSDCRLTKQYVVHPGSLYLLEPLAGDVAQHPMNGNCHVLCGTSCFQWFRDASMRIIQRNGVAFHWP